MKHAPRHGAAVDRSTRPRGAFLVDDRRRPVRLRRLDRAGAAASRDSRGAKSEVTFSPDGRTVAFIKQDNDLHVARGRTCRPANEASDCTTADRSYSTAGSTGCTRKSCTGAAITAAYWWSPDSSHIAFLQLDETAVPDYTLIDDIPYHPTVRAVELSEGRRSQPGCAARRDLGRRRSRSLDRHLEYSDFLIVNVGWTPDSRAVVYQIQNREQTWLDLNRAACANAAVAERC